MAFDKGGAGSFPGGNFPKGEGGDNHGSHKLPNEGLSQAEYQAQIEREAADAAHGKGPRRIDSFKRWFSARF